MRDARTGSSIRSCKRNFQSYRLTVRNPGGHSSLPEKDNAIYRLAAALGRVGEYEFPFELNAITREYLARTATLSEGELAADSRAVGAGGRVDTAAARRLANRSPFYNALLRTTCVATLIEGGHAVNALPQRAVATINCRILPGVDPASVEETIRRVVADSAVSVTRADTATPSPPSPLPAPLEQTIRSVVVSIWGSVLLVPTMDTGASDGLYLRNAGIPVYGVSGYFADPNIPADTRAHGLNERIGVKAYYDQLEFTYRLLKRLATAARCDVAGSCQSLTSVSIIGVHAAICLRAVTSDRTTNAAFTPSFGTRTGMMCALIHRRGSPSGAIAISSSRTLSSISSARVIAHCSGSRRSIRSARAAAFANTTAPFASAIMSPTGMCSRRSSMTGGLI